MIPILVALALATAQPHQLSTVVDIDAVNGLLDKPGAPQVEPIFATRDKWGDGPGSQAQKWFGPISGYFPERADRYSVSGAVVLDCTVSPAGRLSDCKTLIETPTDWAFSDAALAMVKDGYMTTKLAPGAKDGDRARLLIQFINHHRW